MAISIQEPCHEDWSKMTPTQRGSFCGSCSKEVIDFTDKSAFEIKSIFAKEFAENKSPCARITNYQLNQINDDFFKWKSDRESFKAVWIFSLIAVFGLSLFSCQNTLSKEMVNQLHVESSLLLDSIEVADLVAVDTMSPDFKEVQDSENKIRTLGGVPISVDWPIIYGGTSPWNPGFLDSGIWISSLIAWPSCDIVLGGWHVPEKETQDLEKFLEAGMSPFLQTFSSEPNPNQTGPSQPNPLRVLPKLEGIAGSGDKKFDAFVYPNPIVKSSKLYVDAHDFINLKIAIFQKGEETPLHEGYSTLGFGNHALDANLFNLNHGEYFLKLDALDQISVLDFVV